MKCKIFIALLFFSFSVPAQNYVELKNNYKKYLAKAKREDVNTFFKKFFSHKLKDEFETTKEYDERSKIDSTKIFVFPLEIVYEPDRYNADRQEYYLTEWEDHKRFYFVADPKSYIFESKDNAIKFINSAGEETFDFSFYCPIEKAKGLKDKIGALLGISFAHYDDRSEYLANHKIIAFKISGYFRFVAFYDKRTNEILEIFLAK